MDNIGDLLSSVLSDPDAMTKLRDTAKQFGIDTDSLLGDAGVNEASDVQTSQPTENSSPLNFGANAEMLSAIAKITPLLSKLNEEDDMTRLIHALRPYLSGDRRKKADEADKIMAVMRLIPLLKNTNL